MNHFKIMPLLLALTLVASCASFVWADEDDDDRGERKNRGGWLSSWFDDDDDDDDEHRGRKIRGNKNLPVLASIPQAPPEFEQECGSCHMAYQPELLPAKSWTELMDGLADHFGEDASIEAETHGIIMTHLDTFSADRSDTRLARKITRSIGNRVTLRISDIPKLRHEHSEHITKKVLKRPAIRSIANCSACHLSAQQGEYDEDFVRIPR